MPINNLSGGVRVSANSKTKKAFLLSANCFGLYFCNFHFKMMENNLFYSLNKGLVTLAVTEGKLSIL